MSQEHFYDRIDLSDDIESVINVVPDIPTPKTQTVDFYEENQPPNIIEFDHQRLVGVCFVSLISALGIMLLIGFLSHPILGILCIFAIAPAVIILTLLIRFKRKLISTELTFELFWSGLLITIIVVIIESLISLIFKLFAASAGMLRQQVDSQKMFDFEFNLVFHFVYTAFNAFIVAGLVEESAKYFLVHRVRNREEFNTPEACIVYAIAGSLGFATLENISYVVYSSLQNPTGSLLSGAMIAAGRSVMSVPLHCICGAIIGVKFARKHFFEENLSIAEVLYISVFIHGLYDFILMFSIPFLQIIFISFLMCLFIVLVAGMYAFKEYAKIQQEWVSLPNPDIMQQSDGDEHTLIDFKNDPHVAIF